MTGLARPVLHLFRCDAGATAIEYSLVAGMIALVIIATVTQIGAEVLELVQGLIGQL